MKKRFANPTSLLLLAVTLIVLLAAAGLKTPRKAWAQKALPASLLMLTNAKGSRRMPANPAIRQSRHVVINWPALQKADMQQLETRTLSLPLPDGKTATIRLEKLEWRTPLRYSWFGRLENAPDSQVILTVEGDALALSIRTDSLIYALRYLGNEVYLLCDLDARQMGRCRTVSSPGLPRPAPDKKSVCREYR
jgi:hypothetical protein